MIMKPVPEKVVQAQVVHLLRSIGASVYVLGTKRARGDHQGTRQTPGIGDLYCFLPAPKLGEGHACALWVEVKSASGRLRPEQAAFRAGCLAAGTAHVVGGVDAVISFLIAGGWLKGDQVAHYHLKGTDS